MGQQWYTSEVDNTLSCLFLGNISLLTCIFIAKSNIALDFWKLTNQYPHNNHYNSNPVKAPKQTNIVEFIFLKSQNGILKNKAKIYQLFSLYNLKYAQNWSYWYQMKYSNFTLVNQTIVQESYAMGLNLASFSNLSWYF